ncbi:MULTISPECIES: diiron oxygenase [unclassified Variovorax]|uniref:diiron oxygenase n=1 Tax=unclassified Variovorax TaxID=663243 RepID=UPI000838906F|nr:MULTISPECIES: diiron oxygenase [unclassified Variovorax]PNG52228.1 hypothetical protein CHC07_04599 [Variovorax sp. B4]PNG54768.1 hypothetical protein CHC06_03565 [Variovorax sp. B2]VTV15764.1 P-aminobenzoate N-oxygenase AurF [Variovorax sp. WDL1]
MINKQIGTSQQKSQRASAPSDEPFDDWLSRSAVRAKPSLTDFEFAGDTAELRGIRWFVLGREDELLSHRLIAGCSVDLKNSLYAARLAHFLEEVALAETRVINVAVQVISENRLSKYFSSQVALEALKLYTDEGYHAYFSASAAMKIRKAFGLTADMSSGVKVRAIETLMSSIPPEWKDRAWFMVGFVGETMISKEIMEIMRSTGVSVMQSMLLAHLEDEWVHSRYVIRLFELMWPKLDEEAKENLGTLLPQIFLAYHVSDDVFYNQVLTLLGVPEDDVKEIVADAFTSESHIRRTSNACGAAFKVLERCGVFESKAIRSAFVRAKLL